MSSLTQDAFFKALEDKFTAAELVELLGLETRQIIQRFFDEVIDNQPELQDELKYGH